MLRSDEFRKMINDRQKHPMVGTEKQTLIYGETEPALSVTAVLIVSTPVMLQVVNEQIEASGSNKMVGYGRRTLPPGGRGGLTRAMPSALLRDAHYRLTVGWLTAWLEPFGGQDQEHMPFFFAAYIVPCTAPIIAAVSLGFAMAVDTVMVTVCGALAVLEYLYLLLRYGAASPDQVVMLAVAEQYRRKTGKTAWCYPTKGDSIALPYDKEGECELPVHLMAPSVNSHTLAAGFLVSVLVIFIELKNLLADIDDEDALRICCKVPLRRRLASCVLDHPPLACCSHHPTPPHPSSISVSTRCFSRHCAGGSVAGVGTARA